MPSREIISTATGIKSPLLSQAVKYGDTIYVSGNVGMNFVTSRMAEGDIADRTRQALLNIEATLREAGSGLQNLLKVNIYLTSMQDYAAMNKVYTEMIPDPKPARTCVAVAELPMKTDVEIECTAHL
ncbi:hypothetical protein LTS08_001354 [Lithohypha guttulata]|uniref:uncharacterized protein n=1 Tax=Lithohypha guttulata TaxID=1690604 RepID=UPI002DDED238|nr:hypothetical protein LTR51_003980 [Lithohypha guttulata]KAK5105080.1 hypothetical protein LTS08_001354 [Lithohypha guttulata]